MNPHDRFDRATTQVAALAETLGVPMPRATLPSADVTPVPATWIGSPAPSVGNVTTEQAQAPPSLGNAATEQAQAPPSVGDATTEQVQASPSVGDATTEQAQAPPSVGDATTEQAQAPPSHGNAITGSAHVAGTGDAVVREREASMRQPSSSLPLTLGAVLVILGVAGFFTLRSSGSSSGSETGLAATA